MASYNAAINIVVSGEQRLNYVLNSVEKLNALTAKLKPINLLAPGGGPGGDAIRVAKKQLDDFARAIVNFQPQGIQRRAKELSNTLAGSAGQADALGTALANVGLKSGGFKQQTAEVKNYALALDTASRNAARLELISRQIQREARIQNIASRFNTTPEAVQARIAGLSEAVSRRQSATGRRTGTGAAATLSSGNFGGIVSNAVIGGAFPLLFGQGGAAATGGALGGIVGGAFGGAGGFAGSLLGTLLGGKIGQANQIKDLAADIGFSAQQTQLLATAFKQAGADFDRFQESVSRIQGLELSIEDQAKAIQLASTLTEAYGGKIDKVTNAFTNALQTGKVTQATLNQLTSQGIPIQQALADKYNVSRSKLLEMAKDGEISVQTLIDTLVKVGNKGAESASKTRTAFEQGFEDIQQAVTYLQQNLTTAFKETANSLRVDLGDAVQAVTRYIADFIRGLGDLGRVAGPALDPVISGYINIQKAIFNAATAVPGLTTAIVSFASNVLGPLSSTVALIDRIRGTGAASRNAQYGPAVPDRLKQKPLTTFKAPAQMAPSGAGANKTDKAARDAAREAERVAKLLRDTQAQTELLKIQAGLQDKIFQAEQARDPFLVAKLQGEDRILQIQARYAELIANEPNIRAQEALVAKGLQEIENSRLQTAQAFEKIDKDRKTRFEELLTGLERELELNSIKDELAKKLKQIEFDIIDLRKQGILLTDEEIEAYRKRAQAVAKAAEVLTGQQKMEQELFEGLASTFAGTVTSAFDAAVSGTENFGVALQELGGKLLSTIGQMLVMYSIAQALGALGGGAGNPQGILSFLARAFGYQGKANGGPVTGGTPYLIGERGPELFVPGTSGGVMSNNDLRQSMNGGGSPVLNMSFQTTRFGDTEYVSRDQLEAAMSETRRQASRDGAQRGMTMTLDRLQQSPRTRSRLGMR